MANYLERLDNVNMMFDFCITFTIFCKAFESNSHSRGAAKTCRITEKLKIYCCNVVSCHSQQCTYDSYRVRIKRKIMQKSDEIGQKPNETDVGLHLVK